MINVLLFLFGGSDWPDFVQASENPSAGADFYRLVRSFLNVFTHGSVGALLYAVFCFSACGLFLERKLGSVKWTALVLTLAFLTSAATAANSFSVRWSGFSIVVYGLFGYIVTDYSASLLSGRKNRRESLIREQTGHSHRHYEERSDEAISSESLQKSLIFEEFRQRLRLPRRAFRSPRNDNAIFGAVLIALIYIAMCFDGGAFFGYPRGLLYNLGHTAGFVTGLVSGLTMQIFGLNFKEKKPVWLTKNVFFAGTALILSINILLFALGGKDWPHFVAAGGQADFGSLLYIHPTLRGFLNAFAHLNWAHVLSNMIGFVVCGFYLEKKTGSANLFLMILAIAYFTAVVSVASTFTAAYWLGFSGILFLLYAYVIVDFLFSLRKIRKNRQKIITGVAVVVFIYVNMSYRGTAFVWYPYNLIFHEGHLFGFLAGLALGLAVGVIKLVKLRERK
ncbi:MAG: rhomboid family intramembrane serine protease [Firmicutes bacterium]|nr:rhomboid family intramembrane serine protease [Bacillota bacterium]